MYFRSVGRYFGARQIYIRCPVVSGITAFYPLTFVLFASVMLNLDVDKCFNYLNIAYLLEQVFEFCVVFWTIWGSFGRICSYSQKCVAIYCYSRILHKKVTLNGSCNQANRFQWSLVSCNGLFILIQVF